MVNIPGVSAVGKAPGAIGGAVAGGASAIVGDALKSLSHAGFVLFLVSSIFFALSIISGLPEIYIWVSLGLLIYANFTIFQKKGSLVISLFVIWYFFMGAVDITRSPLHAVSIVILAAFVHGLTTKFGKQHSFFAGFKGELVSGGLMILIYFIDIGLVQYAEASGYDFLPEVLLKILELVPIWSYIGLYYMVGSKEKTATVTIASFLGVIYLALVLMFVSADLKAAIGVENGDSLIASPEEILKEKQEAKPEKRFFSMLRCIDKLFQYEGNIDSCIEKNQEESLWKAYCKKEEKHKVGSPGFIKCMERKRKEKQDPSLKISGSVDPTIKLPTTAKLEVDKAAFPPYYQPDVGFQAQFTMQNPRKQRIKVKFSCNFFEIKSKKNIQGVIEGEDEFEFTDEEVDNPIICHPKEKINGSCQINISADLSDLTTTSRLTRAFVGEKVSSELKQLKNEEIIQVVSKKESQAAKELARINFDLGHKKGEVVIEGSSKKNILLQSNIENIGGGKILTVKNYNIGLAESGFEVSNRRCLEGSISQPKAANKFPFKQPLPACLISSLPSELKDPVDWLTKEFHATIKYDYQITKSVNFNIEPELELT